MTDENLLTLIGSLMLAPVLTLLLFAVVRYAHEKVYGWTWLAFLVACAMWVGVALYLFSR